jgi:predicted RNase H-like nuclease
MQMTGVDGCPAGWVAVTLGQSGGPAQVRAGGSLAALLTSLLADGGPAVVGIDMPLGLLEAGWREADRAARGQLGPRRSSMFAIPPRAVWAEPTYPAANRRCRELTGQGFSIQAWGLRAKLLEANAYRAACGYPLYEVHPELAFGAIAGQPLAHSKHTPAGRELRRELLARAGIVLPGITLPGPPGPAPATDMMDAAAAAWSAARIAAGQEVVLPDHPQRDPHGREIAVRY